MNDLASRIRKLVTPALKQNRILQLLLRALESPVLTSATDSSTGPVAQHQLQRVMKAAIGTLLNRRAMDTLSPQDEAQLERATAEILRATTTVKAETPSTPKPRIAMPPPKNNLGALPVPTVQKPLAVPTPTVPVVTTPPKLKSSRALIQAGDLATNALKSAGLSNGPIWTMIRGAAGMAADLDAANVPPNILTTVKKAATDLKDHLGTGNVKGAAYAAHLFYTTIRKLHEANQPSPGKIASMAAAGNWEAVLRVANRQLRKASKPKPKPTHAGKT